MTLPRTSLPTKRVKLSSGQLEVRGLSRGEALKMASHGEDITALEVDLIHLAAGVSEDEAREWHDQAPSADVQNIVNAVIELSGLDGSLGKA